MGEIGIDRNCFLKELRWWEVRSIIRGYNRRQREMWSATRWQTYCLMETSMADLKKAGIEKPGDLLVFPWEETDRERGEVSESDIKELQELMDGGLV